MKPPKVLSQTTWFLSCVKSALTSHHLEVFQLGQASFEHGGVCSESLVEAGGDPGNHVDCVELYERQRRVLHPITLRTLQSSTTICFVMIRSLGAAGRLDHNSAITEPVLAFKGVLSKGPVRLITQFCF